MRVIISALLAIGLAGSAHAQFIPEFRVPPPLSPHDNVRLEAGQLIACEAIHIELSHIDLNLATIMAASHNQVNAERARGEIKESRSEMAKTGVISRVLGDITPSLHSSGLTDDLIDQTHNRLLADTISDIDIISNQLMGHPSLLLKLQKLLRQQSATCDKFVTDTENKHTT